MIKQSDNISSSKPNNVSLETILIFFDDEMNLTVKA
jgi:hypothetical protein